MNNLVDGAIRRTYGYFYEDGLVEIAVGFLFSAVALLLSSWMLVRSGTTAGIIMAIGLPLLIIAGTYGINRAVTAIKERVVYPRTGYVSYQQDKPSKGRYWIIVGVLGIMVLLLLLPEWFSQIAVVEGAILCLVLVHIGRRVGLKRFYLLGGLALLIGLAVGLLAVGDALGTSLTFGATGIILIISGVYAFGRYLLENPRMGEEME